MSETAIATPPQRLRGLALMFAWPRVRFTLIASFLWGLLLSSGWTSGFLSIVGRTMFLGLLALFVFGLFEQWPKRLPRWLARWVLQVIGVAAVIPIATAIIYALSTSPGAQAFYQAKDRMEGFSTISMTGVLFAPWIALGALVRQKEALARHQALAFNLERSELERQALDARLRLLQAQVAPHFLFNTLANVQALVDAGSPQAAVVLRSLVAYLRAAVPRLNEPTTTLGQELELVRAYLDFYEW
jgi:MFS family permease